MIGYYLIITALLPTIIVTDPTFLKQGTYVTYLTEDLGLNGEVIRNGTYTWRIASISTHPNGTTLVQINETFNGDSQWRARSYSIPPSGRTTEVDSKQGEIDGLRIWFGNYYNEFLLDHTIFLVGKEYALEGAGFREVPFEASPRACMTITYPSSFSEQAYDRATGVLLLDSYSFRGVISTRATAVSTNISLSPYNSYSKLALDLLLLCPLIVLPSFGAPLSLWFLKRNKTEFSVSFWLIASVVLGTTISLVTVSPGMVYNSFGYYSSGFSLMFLMMLIVFWSVIVLSIVILIDRFWFRILQHSRHIISKKFKKYEFSLVLARAINTLDMPCAGCPFPF